VFNINEFPLHAVDVELRGSLVEQRQRPSAPPIDNRQSRALPRPHGESKLVVTTNSNMIWVFVCTCINKEQKYRC